MLVGAGAAGAAVVAVTAVPQSLKAPPMATMPETGPEQGGGYRLSAHVMRYYQTAKV